MRVGNPFLVGVAHCLGALSLYALLAREFSN